MPLRLSIQPVRSQLQACASRLTRPLATTSRREGLRDDVRSPGASVLNLDGGAAAPARPRAPSETYDSVLGVLRAQRGRSAARRLDERQRTLDQLRESQLSDAYLRQMPRRWAAGDVYAPHDLSPQEAQKFRRPRAPRMDVMDALGVNPVDEYRNFSVISEFVTSMGRIKHSVDTGLRPVNQRRMAKAVRRAIGMGIHPSVHAHPEILKTEMQNLAPQNRPRTTGAKRAGSLFDY